LNLYGPRGYVKELPLSRGEYFRFCISHSTRILQSDSTNIEELELVRAYETLNHYRSKVFMNIQRVTIRGNEIEYINNKPNDSFIEENETEQFNSMVEVLTQKDYFIGSEVFDFKRSFLRPENRDEISKKVTAIYNYIKEDFF